ncbi:alkaline shock response membrane anchor protein AmaP [Streptomyces alkaliterrae]|uniref:Alkaline shock response membrane anchor protein AmaP n=1 Tax=Streptomyces alkaliterrae TaxID=2213162 RepID=A0A5P0YJ71_9ACTN|nr:alkaline shock response membrane anchor protein AmaP [Streptomyces alkaliterrae]MBB1252059.1 alkaline shock response membrane anchor protein AmaP [Streptomyces alkaliterrae]MBB1259860.1 alkaline shock response membrane anchor protein AmaP [Streptomyces alkaliterrae]MQS00423.1 alkaline shock response membrane anchor protein AmaP [Streptomyces alkaliterrae]
MLRVTNRLLLGLVGLGLLALGAAALVAAADLPARWGFGLPSGWSWTGPQEVVLAEGDRTQWRGERWWWPTVFAVLGALVALLLWWLLAQLGRGRVREMTIGRPAGDGPGERPGDGPEERPDNGPDAVLRARALEEAMADEAGTLPGVQRAAVRLVGRPRAPRARIGLLLEPYAVPDEAVHLLGTEVLENARTSAGLAQLPAETRLRAVRHRPSRVG